MKLSNTGATKTQSGDLFLLPAASKVWRIIANKYQFFVFTPGTSSPREFACGGVPYLPSFLQGVITECLWGHGNASSDTITTAAYSFRSQLLCSTTTSVVTPNQFSLVNGSICEWSSGTNANGGPTGNTPYSGMQILMSFTGANGGTVSSGSGRRWHDSSLYVMEPLIAWGTSNATDEGLVRGQLWDAIIVVDSFPVDTTITFDGRTYWAVGSSAGGTVGTSLALAPGTLFVAVT